MRSRKIRACLRLSVVLLCIPKAVTAVPLQFAIPAMQAGLSRLEQWTPIVEYLEGECSFEIDLLIVKNHRELIEGLENRFFDIGFMNALWEHRLTSEGNFLTRARLAVGGESHYFTHIVVNKDSVIRRMGELGGDYLALTVPYDSLGGFYIPLLMCLQAGIEAPEAFRQVVFSETYTSILKGVAFGVVDAGAVTSDVLSAPEMKEYRSEVRSVGVSKPLPQWALVARVDHKTMTVDRFISELIEMSSEPEGRQILEAAGFTAFVPAEEAFESIPLEYLDLIEEIDALPR
jgi:ABC-type phosphate/phosphonate transport system substrate-binding protein